ncbi:MAG: hypothetical protein ABFE07_29015 [Armatimonadia bacterium]
MFEHEIDDPARCQDMAEFCRKQMESDRHHLFYWRERWASWLRRIRQSQITTTILPIAGR